MIIDPHRRFVPEFPGRLLLIHLISSLCFLFVDHVNLCNQNPELEIVSQTIGQWSIIFN